MAAKYTIFQYEGVFWPPTKTPLVTTGLREAIDKLRQALEGGA